MYELLQILGCTPAPQQKGHIKLYLIHNPDGSPRWIWNAENPAPDFLRFYAVSGLRARVFSMAIRCLFFFRMQHWFFGKYKVSVVADTAHVLYPFVAKNFALFTGTEGPNRKMVLFAQGKFIKIALHEHSARLIEQEKETLIQLPQMPCLEIPQASSLAYGLLALSDIGQNAARSNTFTTCHARALSALYAQQTMNKECFGATKVFHHSIENLAAAQDIAQGKMPVYLSEKLSLLAHLLENEQLFCTWAHGDFTPWNCFVAGEKIRLYDFELARPEMPFGFDAFHFVLQQGVLADRQPWHTIKPKLRAAFDLLCSETGMPNTCFDACLKAYLLVNTAYYWRVYSLQEKWHTQVAWLLNTWNDALSDLLAHHDAPRSLLIGDVFDFLKYMPCAALKFPDIPPKNLSVYADIDLLLPKNAAKDLLAYLQNHSLVQKIRVQQQSNMMHLMLVLNDGSLLALDLIWQLRRKALEFMRVSEVLEHAVVNQFGLKTLSASHTQHYLKCFYTLNNAEIPTHYQHYFEGASDACCDAGEWRKAILQMPENKGFKGLRNKINYLFDTLKKPFQQRGIVITFSGVDGAGKSTIIEHTRRELEKKLRKKVVVIRHRPSLLPILSAFTQGKKKAEQKAASTLPRQGNNKSLIGSLLRFAYYYTDYFFGQFYVYAKYVLRGDVVLYDRYYFDFINDSVRSNIRLPKWLPRAAYKLLMQPHLNFFLYADAETILSRKKELDARAIGQLTHDYLSLFKDLEAKNSGRYYPLENLQLSETLHFITTQAQARLI
jgi:thymidylate kinase